MIGANGFKIIDLGIDVLNETVVEEAAKHKGEKVLLVGSALMTTSMLGQKTLMDLTQGRKPQGQRKMHVRRSSGIREMD